MSSCNGWTISAALFTLLGLGGATCQTTTLFGSFTGTLGDEGLVGTTICYVNSQPVDCSDLLDNLLPSGS